MKFIVDSYSCEYARDIIKKYGFLKEYKHQIEIDKNFEYLIVYADFDFIKFMLDNVGFIRIEKWNDDYKDNVKFNYYIKIEDEMF